MTTSPFSQVGEGIKRIKLSSLLLPATLILFAAVSPTTAYASYILLAVYALSGYSSALKALCLAWLIGTLNSGVSYGSEVGGIGWLVVFAAAAASVFGRAISVSRFNLPRETVLTIGLGVTLVMHSLLFSQMPDVSVLKAISWAVVTATIFQAFSQLSPIKMHEFTIWFFIFCVTIMVVSWPFVFSSLGFSRNGRGFQGVLNQPQAYGIFLGLLSAWGAAINLQKGKISAATLFVFGSSITALVLTQSRTGGIAFIVGVSASITLLIFVGKFRELSAVFRRMVVLMSIVTLLAISTIDWWLRIALGYIFKGYDVDQLSELYASSRGFLYERALDNFYAYPFTGIGFGIDIVREMKVAREPFFGFPTSAPIEKGNAFVASLEEVGLVFSGLILVWLLVLLRRAVSGGLVPLTMFFSVMALNIGEAIFFSPGGVGLLTLIFLGWSVHQRTSRTQGISHG